MRFEEYSERRRETVVYGPNQHPLLYTVLGLCSEAGELAGKIKKMLRDDGGIMTAERQEEVMDEAGDVLWYLDAIVCEIGRSLDQAARKNIAKLASRRERGVLSGSGDNR